MGVAALTARGQLVLLDLQRRVARPMLEVR
jgi:hypothetical protein